MKRICKLTSGPVIIPARWANSSASDSCQTSPNTRPSGISPRSSRRQAIVVATAIAITARTCGRPVIAYGAGGATEAIGPDSTSGEGWGEALGKRMRPSA